jgi:hypothetical protein
MKSLRATIFLFVAALLTAGAAMGQIRIDNENVNNVDIQAEDGGTLVVINWSINDLDLISSYSLERNVLSNSSGFQELNRNSCVQSGNRFRCEDRDLYKGSTDETAATGSVSYRLRVTHQDGTPHVYFTADNISYTTNAVRRTWGSIKSMFQ